VPRVRQMGDVIGRRGDARILRPGADLGLVEPGYASEKQLFEEVIRKALSIAQVN
jgi:hypothetical protein